MSEAPARPAARRPIEAVAFEGANSRAYLDALFDAHAEGRVAAVLPRGQAVRSIPGVRVTARERFADDPGWYARAVAPAASDAPAQIAFTSGTTGRPKPLLLSHRALADVTLRINAAMAVDERISEYVGVPVTFSFGFGRVRAVAAAGGRAYLPPNGFDPAEIGRMLAAGEINAVSAVPTLWRVLLGDPSAIGMAARRRLKWIEIGSQYMARSEKEALKRLFRNARIVQHYGLTEASRTTLLDISETEGAALESVGRPTGSVEIALSEGGLVRIRGPHLADGVVTGAGVKPITDADGWFTTADRGRIAEGLLHYEGREDEVINCGGVKVDPTRFEQRLAERLGAGNAVAAARLPDSLRGERVLVAVEAGAGIDAARLEEAAAAVARESGLTRGAIALRTLETLPRTATGKVRRAALAEAAAGAGEAPSPAPSAPAPAGEAAPAAAPESAEAAEDPAQARARALQAVWAEVLGTPAVPLDRGFYDLGGDSLSALTVMLRMERLGIDAATARGLLEGRSIAELTGLAADAAAPPPAAAPPAAETPAPAPEAPADGEDGEDTARARARALQAVWAEVLGTREVALDRSFYDLGGDSLSALTVMLRMERLGIDAATARGLLEGRSIAELTGLAADDTRADDARAGAPAPAGAPDAPAAAPAGGTAPPPAGGAALPPATVFVWALNAVRGLAALLVVFAHWSPGAIIPLAGAAAGDILNALLPVFRAGTPSFAFIFGVGVGHFLLRESARMPGFTRRRVLTGLALVASALALLAAATLALALLEGRAITPLRVVNAFYGVLAYYLLAFLTLPLWLAVLRRSWAGPGAILAMALGFWALGWVARAVVPPEQIQGFLEWPKMMLTAKYNYFSLSAVAFAGIAVGRWLSAQTDPRGVAVRLMLAGGTVAAAALLVIGEAYPQGLWPVPEDRRFLHFVFAAFYCGTGTALLGLAVHLFAAMGAEAARPGLALRALLIAGVLALPIYAFHQLVIPVRDILVVLGLPGAPALALPMALFLLAMGLAGRHIHGFYFRGRDRGAPG